MQIEQPARWSAQRVDAVGLPQDLADELRTFAEDHGITVREAAVRLIRSGLRAMADRAADGMD